LTSSIGRRYKGRTMNQEPPSSVCLLFVTAPADAAGRIAEAALAARTVACANLVPGVVSRYWWKGALETSSETLIVFKTTAERAPEAMNAIRSAHPYDVPEILSVPVETGLPAYLDWVRQSVELPA
jgi:periplasmic divalent cation tolerance protein